MISAFIAYDDFDDDLGDYFDQSFQYVQTFTAPINHITCFDMDSTKCTEAHVNEALKDRNGQPFVFTAFSHGMEDGSSLCAGEDDEYVCANNSHLFCHSLFYSTACMIGSLLGGELTDNFECRSFVGYIDDSYAPYDDAHNKLFIECELHALREFLTSTKSIEVTYNEMLDKMEQAIDYLYANDEYIDASNMEKNREALIHLGSSKHWTSSDFMVIN